MAKRSDRKKVICRKPGKKDVCLEMLDCNELLAEYLNTFNKNFLIFKVNQMNDDDVKGIIRDCIAQNKPFRGDYYKKGCTY